jgi:vancomycin resistance protein VanW
LQYNKVRNLQLAGHAPERDHHQTGETFSFCRLVGKPTRRKGYLEGMELAHGEARRARVAASASFQPDQWLVLHSPLTITERHHHGLTLSGPGTRPALRERSDHFLQLCRLPVPQ